MLVSVIIPAYNEEQTIRQVLESVHSLPFEKQIIVVNDGSTDKTYGILQKYADESEIMIVNCEKNSGKGFAIRSGIPYVKGKIVVIQDADMELSPSDIVELVRPLKTETAKVVYGSRFLNGRQNASLQNYIANRILAVYTNILFGSKITDESTGYKAFSSDVIRKLNLTCEGFEFCPEVTAKLLRAGFDIQEVPVSYFPRTKKEGKKLRFWFDGIFAAWTLLKYRFTTKSKLFIESTEE